MNKTDKKTEIVVTLENGETVIVTHDTFLNGIQFRGNVSPTGFRSDFPFPYGYEPSLEEVKEVAQARAQQLYNENPAKHGVMDTLF